MRVCTKSAFPKGHRKEAKTKRSSPMHRTGKYVFAFSASRELCLCVDKELLWAKAVCTRHEPLGPKDVMGATAPCTTGFTMILKHLEVMVIDLLWEEYHGVAAEASAPAGPYDDTDGLKLYAHIKRGEKALKELSEVG
jgi:hypothetical protein